MKGLNVFPEAKFSLRPTRHGLSLGFVYLEELFSLLVGHLNYIITYTRDKDSFNRSVWSQVNNGS